MRKTNESGQALVEIAFSLGIFPLLVWGTIEFGTMYSYKVTLQNAVRQAGRYAITGQCTSGNNCTAADRYNAIIEILEGTSQGLINSNNVGDVAITCTNLGGGCPVGGAGGPGDEIVITVTYPYQFVTGPITRFFPSGYTITVASSVTNEMFPPAS
jgi:Flp pilus assembly protein TadG